MYLGRREIFTDVEEITENNVIQILREAMTVHTANASECDSLIKFEKGNQPLVREKTYRKDIDIQCIDNVANAVIDFWTSYGWGNPMTLKQVDNSKEDISEGVNVLNKFFDAEDYNAKTQDLAYYVETCGIGYSYIDFKKGRGEGDSPFEYIVLDPRCAFIVKSSRYADKRPMLNVSFRKDSLGNRYFTVFSKERQFEIVNLAKIVNGRKIVQEESWYSAERSGELNPMGVLPFTEWKRATDRMGRFERCVDDMNTLNVMWSDLANDIDQNTQSIWHCNDVEFAEDENGNVIKPKTNEWFQTFTSQDGRTPFVTPLHINYDYAGILNNVNTKRTFILQNCNVPQRNDNSGGSTGIAMSDATGWTNAEVAASKQDLLKTASKMNEVKIALSIIKKSSIDDEDKAVLNIKHSQIKPNIKRQKTYEMTTKINAYATGVSHGIDYQDMLAAINLFDDPQAVAKNSAESTRKYLESIFNVETSISTTSNKNSLEKPNSDRLMPDMSDQIENSPRIDSNRANNG